MTLDHRMASPFPFRQSDYSSVLKRNERRETKTELYCSIGVVLYTEQRPEARVRIYVRLASEKRRELGRAVLIRKTRGPPLSDTTE